MSVTEQMRRNDREKLQDRRETTEGAVDRRVLRTRMALHRALIGLILARDYDEISIGDITDAADVGRSTFYAHFTDKDDLLRSGLGHLRDMLLEERKKAVSAEEGAAMRALGFSRFMTAHLKEQHQLYRALMRGRAGPIVIDKIKELLSELVRAELPRRSASRSSAAAHEIAVRFLVGAYMSVVTWWLDRGAKDAPEDIDRAFRNLALDGLNALLRS